MIALVAYYRVSTDRQGRSGLGLEVQREAVTRFLAGPLYHFVKRPDTAEEIAPGRTVWRVTLPSG